MTAQIRHTALLDACGAVVSVDGLSTCRRRGSNPDSPRGARDFKSSTTLRYLRQQRQTAAGRASHSGSSGICGNSRTPNGTDSPHLSPALIVAAVRRARGGRR